MQHWWNDTHGERREHS